MSELEHALRTALSDPPIEQPPGINAMHDIERRLWRRRQRRRRTGLGALAACAVAAVAVPIATLHPNLGSSASNGSAAVDAKAGGAKAAPARTPATTAPAAVRKAAADALQDRGAHASDRAEWVETTVSKWWTPDGDSTATARSRIYVIQLYGHFTCTRCRTPVGVMKGNVELIAQSVDPKLNYGGISFQDKPNDLAKLGPVHTFNPH
jgi:hypothetical protein